MNKKTFVSIVVALILLFGFQWLGKKSKKISTPEPAVTEQTPVAKADPVVKTSKPSAARSETPHSPVAATTSTKEFLQLQGASLYQTLFDSKALTHLTSEDVQKISQYFNTAYPRSGRQYQSAVVDRLGILNALEQQSPLKRAPSSTLSPALSSLYKTILTSPQEHWLVKRQAFKNLKTSLSSAEREAWYGKLDSRVVSLAASSEADILEEVVREKQSR